MRKNHPTRATFGYTRRIMESRARLILPFALIVAILSVSTASIFIRAAQKDAPSIVIAAVRLSVATLVLAPIALTQHRRQLASLAKNERLLALLSGVFLAAHFATWITSLEYTTVVSSVVFVSTGPLWVALLSPVFLKELPARLVWIGMTLALLGGIIVGLGDSCSQTGFSLSCPPLSTLAADSSFRGNFLALMGAWALAGYLIIGRKLRAHMDLIPYIFVVYGVAAVVLIALMLVSGQSPLGFPPVTYLYMLGLALVPQLIGHSTYNWALKYMPASLVSITTLGEPVGSAILALLLLGEVPSPLTLGGGALILAGIFLASKANNGGS